MKQSLVTGTMLLGLAIVGLSFVFMVIGGQPS